MLSIVKSKLLRGGKKQKMYYGNYSAAGTVDCPVCGEREVGALYFNGWDECVGCDCCVTVKPADEYLDELLNGRIAREVRARLEERIGEEWS